MKSTRSSKLVGILKNEESISADNWINACHNLKINYKVIDILSSNWLDEILSVNYDFFVHFPPARYEYSKNMFDERLYIINKVLGYNTFPTFEESIIYENKKMLSYFLKAKNIPHANTFVFYDYEEAVYFVDTANYPIVAKTSIGATGSGVKIIENRHSAFSYIKLAFKGSGIRRRIGPNRVTGNPGRWLIKALESPNYFKNRLSLYTKIFKNVQKNYVIFQEYIPHEFEWKMVKIGKSYFAHKKVKVGQKASGSKVKQFEMPDNKLLNFIENLCKQNNFNSVDIDLFENNGNYLINEIQCVFGIPYGYLMKIDDKKGRLIKKNNDWLFEEGDFTVNECCNLRLLTAIDIFGYQNNIDWKF